MRRASVVAVLVASLATLLPTASAHLTVTATAPTAPLVPGEATSIPVEFSANCAVVLAEYEVDGRSPLEVVLNPGTPAWIAGVGDKVPFTFDKCGTDGNVRGSGTIAVTPGPFAPGLQQVNLSIGAKNAKGAAEAGEALVPITIAYYGVLDVTTPATEIRLDNGTATLDLWLNATLNADSMAMIEVVAGPEHGTLGIATSVNIASALAENQTQRAIPFQFTYTANPGDNFTMDSVTLRFLMHAAADPGSITPAQEITFQFSQPQRPAAVEDAEEAGGFAPGPGLALIAGAGLAALAIARRRR